ncbi:MAG: hypothetical protein IJV72_03785, partial [Clostridia bacterium]|nr:hypothetical protein [Clostridia bacterium]
FSYVYLDWTTSDENCKAIQHIVVLLGFDSKTGEYAEKYENTYELGDYDHNLFYQEIPTYDDEGNHTGFITTETCQRCGAVTYKRITVLYTDENGDEVSEHDSYYYDVDAGESKVRNHERETYIRRTVLLKNGETRSVEILSRTERYGDDEVIDYWTEYVYSYDDEFCCTGTRTYRRYDQNKGDIYEDTYTIDNHGMSNTETIVESTCTQNGIVVYRCVYCEYSRESETYSMGHSYRNVSADLWECTRCGLQNFTGADGEVIFEDLTADRGNGSQYVVGYRNHWGSDYVFSLYLVVDGEENPVELEVVDDGTSLVYIDAYAVAEMAKAMGYEPCDYMVCLRFVPIGDDFGYYYDFAITLDPHVYALDAENCVTPDTPCVDETVTAYKCAICGDIYTESTILEHDIEWISYSIGECGSAINCEVCKTCNKTFTIERYIACPFEMTAATETDENGVVHSIETYVCGICGASYQVEYYTLSNGDCFGENYEITRWGLQDDGSYSFEVVMSEQTENHVYTTTSDKTEDGLTVTVVKKTACQSCGKTSYQSINVTVLDENGNTVSQLTESLNESGFYTKNFREYFYTEDGTRYEASHTYEHRDSDGVVLKGYTTVYEYNFEAGVRYWTRTDINGMVTTGDGIITSK